MTIKTRLKRLTILGIRGVSCKGQEPLREIFDMIKVSANDTRAYKIIALWKVRAYNNRGCQGGNPYLFHLFYFSVLGMSLRLALEMRKM